MSNMTIQRLFSRYRYSLQVAIVICASVTFTLVTDALDFRSPANLAWMVGPPALIALTMNIGWDRRCFMVMALTGISLVAMIVAAASLTSYP